MHLRCIKSQSDSLSRSQTVGGLSTYLHFLFDRLDFLPGCLNWLSRQSIYLAECLKLTCPCSNYVSDDLNSLSAWVPNYFQFLNGLFWFCLQFSYQLFLSPKRGHYDDNYRKFSNLASAMKKSHYRPSGRFRNSDGYKGRKSSSLFFNILTAIK